MPRTTQPQGAVHANPFWRSRGLRLLATGDLAYDAATGILTPYTNTSDTPLVTANSLGVGRQQSGAASYNTTRNLFTNGNFVAIWAGSLPTSASAATYAISQGGADCAIAFGGNFDDQFVAGAGNSGKLSLTCLDVGTNRSHAYVANAVDGTPHVYLMRRAGTTVTAWIDGVSRTVVSSGGFPTPGSGYTSSADTFRVCGSSVGGANFWGVLNTTAVLNGVFTDAECALLSSVNGVWNLYADDSYLDVAVLFRAASGGANEGIAAAAGVSAATATSGSIAFAVGTNVASGIAGAIALATGVSTASVVSGALAAAAGISTASALAGAVAVAAGAATVQSIAGSVAVAAGVSTAQALGGAVGAAAGTSSATAQSQPGSIAAAAGSSTVSGLTGSIGSSAGTSTAAGYSSAASIAEAAGSSSTLAIAGFIATTSADSSAIAVSGAIAVAVGGSVVNGVGLSGNAGIGVADGASSALAWAGSIGEASGFAAGHGSAYVLFRTVDARYLVRPTGRRFTART